MRICSGACGDCRLTAQGVIAEGVGDKSAGSIIVWINSFCVVLQGHQMAFGLVICALCHHLLSVQCGGSFGQPPERVILTVYGLIIGVRNAGDDASVRVRYRRDGFSAGVRLRRNVGAGRRVCGGVPDKLCRNAFRFAGFAFRRVPTGVIYLFIIIQSEQLRFKRNLSRNYASY